MEYIQYSSGQIKLYVYSNAVAVARCENCSYCNVLLPLRYGEL